MQGSTGNVLLPETAPVKAVLLAWPFPNSDWRHNLAEAQACYTGILASFLHHSQGVDIVVLLHPSISLAQWQEEVGSEIVHHPCLKVVNTIDYNDTWIRDYGPLSLSGGYFCFTFDGWGEKYPAEKDNQVALQVMRCLGEACDKSPWVAEGGALEINAQACLLANRDCLVDERRNPGKTAQDIEQALRDTLGIQTFIWLEGLNLSGDDTDGHIDTLARFCEHNGIVYCGENSQHPDNPILQNLRQQVEHICQRYTWQSFALPTPVIHSGVDGRLLPGSYANFLIVNSLIFLPIYGVQEDIAAEAVLQKAFPNYRVVPIDCAALLEQHGSLHCATMQIAKLPSK